MFAGTRVPVGSLFDYLEGGESLDEFLRQFPSVRRDQAIAALDMARESLLAGAFYLARTFRSTWPPTWWAMTSTPSRARRGVANGKLLSRASGRISQREAARNCQLSGPAVANLLRVSC